MLVDAMASLLAVVLLWRLGYSRRSRTANLVRSRRSRTSGNSRCHRCHGPLLPAPCQDCRLHGAIPVQDYNQGNQSRHLVVNKTEIKFIAEILYDAKVYLESRENQKIGGP